MSQAFLAKYFSPSKTAKLCMKIQFFTQNEGKSYIGTWERYKDLLRACSHHGLQKWLTVHTFYNGLTYNTRSTVDAAAGGFLMNKSVQEGYNLLKEMALHHHQWSNKRANPAKTPEKYEVDAFTMLNIKMDALASNF
ncbi:UNVERIFIED_CONTAM: hypothetical protein Slati_2761500 [Sesamum latifolium]|uniref:Retrotransposon gag domain-containing protein n=1 Tax=Sesamum latifolium TaxID=2727402 RepID=A0AAW2VXY8_9LAMI